MTHPRSHCVSAIKPLPGRISDLFQCPAPQSLSRAGRTLRTRVYPGPQTPPAALGLGRGRRGMRTAGP